MATRLVLDCDTGTDDAVAIMLAALHPDLDLVGVTTVNGNVPVELCTENSLRVLDHVGRPEIPVHRGAATPFAREDFPTPRSGLDRSGMHGGFLDLPPAVSSPASGGAVRFLLDRFASAADAEEDLVLVATGPLTNLALCLKEDPGFARHVRRLVVMGGGHQVVNVTPSAEFNFWADPEAARVVLRSGIDDVLLVPLDATHQALLTYQDCEALRSLGTPAGQATATMVERRIRAHDVDQSGSERGTAPVHDAVCVAVLVAPEVVTAERYYVDVETVGDLTVGRSVVDVHRRSGRGPNARVAMAADGRRFVELLLSTFAAG
ncbi:MAG: nucleoside hydrolase [Acidimicrobiaceae bacterium]|nr:nucleoside hydrolase [Acidimicrobiaceae bacterium]